MKVILTKRPPTLAVALICGLAWTASAHAQHFDPLISQDQPANGKLVVGAYDDGLPGVADPGPVGVFGFDVEFDGSGSPYFGNGEPGFRARKTAEVTPHYGLPGGANLGFSFKTFSIDANSANLWYWDGSGSPSFVPSTGHRLKLKKGASEASATGANSDVAGFTIATTSTIDPNPGIGTIHQHVDTFLSLGASSEPTNLGIYLVGLEFTLSGGHAPSDLTYFVYATLDEEGTITEAMHDSAIDWVQENLIDAQAEAVPEPSSIALAGIAGCLGLMVWGARRRARNVRNR
jgi:hypothetical protein